MNILSMFLKGGILMWPILLASIIAVAIIFDRYLVIRKSKLNVPSFLVRVRSMLKKKDVDGVISFCLTEKSPAANIIRKGLKKYSHGYERVREAILNAGKQEVAKLEKGISTLGTIAGVAPLLGFLGTVTGMINAFMRIEDLQGAANPSDLAGGIWEALITTVFGLIVGIIALTAYNYLLSAINKLVMDMEIISNDVVDVLEEVDMGKTNIQDEIELEL